MSPNMSNCKLKLLTGTYVYHRVGRLYFGYLVTFFLVQYFHDTCNCLSENAVAFSF